MVRQIPKILKILPGLALILFVFAGVLQSQTPAPAPPAESRDPLGRNTPQAAIIHFLEAGHARDYARASHYLDLRQIPAADRTKAGPVLAEQLEDLLDDTPFDIATLSRDPEGDLNDNLPPQFDHLDTFHVDGRDIELQLERVELKPGLHVWLVSAPSVKLIPEAHAVISETPFEKKLPQSLVTVEFLDTPIWRWIVLLIAGPALWYLGGLLSWGLVSALKPVTAASDFRGPLRICLAAAGIRAVTELAPPSTLPRLFIERALGLTFCLALAWAGAVLVDVLADRFYTRLDPRVQTVSFSVLPLLRQILKLSLYLIAVLTIVSAWGYNTSTILAGLGVGGLAVALAAQKTIENLFGGISVIGDRPVLVGDTCRFGDRIGTVMHIGLRSTRLRTPDRTVISVPNAQFSAMSLENLSGRDKIWFHLTLNLRRDTTPTQMSKVLSSLSEILRKHPKVEQSKLPVRLVGVGQWSLDVEVNTYIATPDADEFLAIQQDLLLQMLHAVEAAGTALAVPLQESVQSRDIMNNSSAQPSPVK
jgi:MscS family membrane protein